MNHDFIYIAIAAAVLAVIAILRKRSSSPSTSSSTASVTPVPTGKPDESAPARPEVTTVPGVNLEHAPAGFNFAADGVGIVFDGFSPQAPIPAGYVWNDVKQAFYKQ